MERLNDFLKALIGIILIISFVISFSSCGKNESNQEMKYEEDTTATQKTGTASETTSEEVSSDWNSIKDKVKKEEAELDDKMKELKDKSAKASKTLKSDVDKTIEKLKTKKDGVKADSIKPEFKEEWNSFKREAENTIDSLKAKLK